jgi:hypothetical protein
MRASIPILFHLLLGRALERNMWLKTMVTLKIAAIAATTVISMSSSTGHEVHMNGHG